jgi:hypothetical protein
MMKTDLHRWIKLCEAERRQHEATAKAAVTEPDILDNPTTPIDPLSEGCRTDGCDTDGCDVDTDAQPLT